MAKQHSVKFFESFVKDIHRECQNFVCFDQMVEVSGYICLEIDNMKKERYLLSELIQSSGSVISESFCAKVFRNCPTQKPSAQRGNGKRNMTISNPALNQNRLGQGGVIRQQNILQQSTRTQQSRAGKNQHMQQTPQATRTGQNVQSHVPMTQRVQVSHMNQHPQASPVTSKGAGSMQGRQRHNSASTSLMNKQNNSQLVIVKNPNKPSFNQRLDQAVNSQFDGCQKTKDIIQGVNQQGQGQYAKQFNRCQSVNQQGQGQYTNRQGQCVTQQGQGQCATQLNQCQSVTQQGQGQYTNHQDQCAQQGQDQYRSQKGQYVNQVGGFLVKEGMNQTSVQGPNLGNSHGQNVFPQAVPQGNAQDKSKTAGTTCAIINQEENQTSKEVYQTASVKCNQQNMHEIVHTSALTDQDMVGEVKCGNTDQAPKTPSDSFQQRGSKINVQQIPQAAQTSNQSSKVASRRSSINVGHVGQNPNLTNVPNQQAQRFSAPIPDQVFLQQRETPVQSVDGQTNPVQTIEKASYPSEWQIIEVEPDVSVVSVTPGISAGTLSTKPVSAPGRKDHPFQKDPTAMIQNNPQFLSQGPLSWTQVVNVTASYSPGQTQNISQTKIMNPAQMLKTEATPTPPVQNMNFAESHLKHQPFVSVAQCVSKSQSLSQEAQPAVSHLQNTNLQSGYEKPVSQSTNHPPKLPVCTTQDVIVRVSSLKPSKYGPSSKNLPQSSNQEHRPPVLTQEMEPPVLCLTDSIVNPIPPSPFNSNPHPPTLHKIIDRRQMYNPPTLPPQTRGDVSGPSSSDSFEVIAKRPSFLQESLILRSSLTTTAHDEADKQQIKMKSSMSQQSVTSSAKPSTSDRKTSTSRQMESNLKASAVPPKKAKMSSELIPEDSSVLMSKQTKPAGKKGREISAKKQVKKGRRKSTKPKKVDVKDLTSDEDNYEVSAGPVPKRNLRSAQRTERQVYREEDPDLSDSSVPGDN